MKAMTKAMAKAGLMPKMNEELKEKLNESLKNLKVILLTRWQKWFVPGREEHKFHCDLLLSPGAWVTVEAGTYAGEEHFLIVQNPEQWTKVHIALSWECRDTPFVENSILASDSPASAHPEP